MLESTMRKKLPELCPFFAQGRLQGLQQVHLQQEQAQLQAFQRLQALLQPVPQPPAPTARQPAPPEPRQMKTLLPAVGMVNRCVVAERL